MKINTLAQFEAFLQTRIPTREALFMGDLGLKRAKYFMKLLGNPQNKIKIIHIAGTSGKGSTAHLVSHILQSQGFNVGLSISPHMFDIRERFQVFRSAIASRTRTTNAGHTNILPSEKLVLKYFNQILPAILQMEKCKFGMPTFFEINVALAYFMFAEEKLGYAIMETGLGGLLDATNTVTVKNKVCIITKLGLDHTEILGKTIAKIAGEKAGIIQKNNMAISNQQSASGMRVIKARCQEKSAKLCFINKKNYSVISSTPQETVFDFKFNKNIYKNINLGLIGKHQAENCSLALACLKILSERDKFPVNEQLLRNMLRNIKITGRMEIKKIQDQTIIIDGAHNPQKMQSFTKNLTTIYPKQKFTFVVAFKKSKEYEKMLSLIMPISEKILLTRFSTSNMDNHWSSVDNLIIAKYLQSKNFKNFKIIDNKHSNILKNVGMSSSASQNTKPVVITGSLYLIGKIYPYLKK